MTINPKSFRPEMEFCKNDCRWFLNEIGRFTTKLQKQGLYFIKNWADI
jgi:hypothetical protein